MVNVQLSPVFILCFSVCEMKMSFLYSFKPARVQFVGFTFKVIHLLYFDT